MKISKAYFHWLHSYNSNVFCAQIAALLLLFNCLAPCSAFSQAEPVYDEVTVTLNVQLVGTSDITAIISNEIAYLPITELFNFLKIKNTLSAGIDSVSGFFINPMAYYVIDKVNNRLIYNDSVFNINPADLIATETNLYLRSDYFGRIFGLDCKFNFRSLSVNLTTKLELPVLKEMRQRMMRVNLSRLTDDEKADTVINRDNPLFKLGTADWYVISRQQQKQPSETRVGFTLGSVIAGGETNLSFNHNLNEKLNEREQYYSWRLVNNNNPVMRQLLAGKFFPQSISSIYSPVVGVNITNTPTLYRRSFGTYRMSNVTEPGWIVELYVNEVLMSYVKADASGFFTFDVPLIYGNTVIKLRFYGPWGEERIREGNVTIPFNFIPPNELEYAVSAGIVEDGLQSRFTRATVNYGFNRYVSLGGGLEYLSSINQGKSIPFVSTAVRLKPNLLLSAEYAYGVRAKGILSYRLLSNLQVELDYTKYVKGQQAIKFNYLQERSVVVSLPFRFNKVIGFSRFTLNQKVLPSTVYTTGELLLSAMVSRIGMNLTTYTLYTEPSHPFIYSNLSLNIRLPHQLLFTPQAQYMFSQKKISMVKGQLEKQFVHNGYMNVSFENNFYYRSTNFGLGMRFDLSFAQAGFSSTTINQVTALTQSARGSLQYDPAAGKISAGRYSNVGRGSIVIVPFLDLNANGLRDKNEPKVPDLKIRTRSGFIQYNSKDTTITVLNLEPYASCLITLDSNSFENIAWKLKKKSLRVTVNPNMLTVVDIPVSVIGEVSGAVYFKTTKEQKGLGRIKVNIFKNDSVFVASTLTESDGYFSYLGLEPGAYTAVVDNEQLRKMHLTVLPPALPFIIKSSREGDVAEGLTFVVQVQ